MIKFLAGVFVGVGLVMAWLGYEAAADLYAEDVLGASE
jgi:hypothetical protein